MAVWLPKCLKNKPEFFYPKAGMGKPWAGHTKLKAEASLLTEIFTLSLKSTLGATEPKGSVMRIIYCAYDWQERLKFKENCLIIT